MSYDIRSFAYDAHNDALVQEASTLRLQTPPPMLTVRGRRQDVDFEIARTVLDGQHEDVLAWEYCSTRVDVPTKLCIVND